MENLTTVGMCQDHKVVLRRLDEMEKTQSELSAESKEQGKTVAVLVSQMEANNKSAAAQTKAIWGLVVAVLLTFLGFILEGIPK